MLAMSDSYLFNVGWLFLATWGAIVISVCVAAFGHDLRDRRVLLGRVESTRLTDLVHPTQPTPGQSSHGL